MAVKPSFLKDPDQAAELAALLQDTADTMENDWTSTGRGDLKTRAEQARFSQMIARYRRWAAELVTEPEAEAPAPVQIRPATRHTEEATG
jgi:hypothetical protein